METHVLWVCPPVFTSPRRSAGHQPASGKPSSSRPHQHDRLRERQPRSRGSSDEQFSGSARPAPSAASIPPERAGSHHHLLFCSGYEPLFCLGCFVFILKTGFLCVARAGLKFSILCLSPTVARITGGQHCTQQTAPSEPCCLTRNSPEKVVTAVEGSYDMLDM